MKEEKDMEKNNMGEDMDKEEEMEKDLEEEWRRIMI